VESELAPGPLWVRADSSQIQQVLLNLAVNARDAMPEGGRLTIETGALVVSDEVDAQAELHPGTYAVLTVRDTGQGMDADTLSRLFEPFFTTKGMGRGTGLGLATVYGIVRQHDGHVSVRSARARGSEFTILLPLVGAPAAADERPARDVSAARGDETVLVVEDDEGVRKLTASLLSASGYRVLVAAGGSEALSLAAREAGPIDLLLTDVIMAGLNGRELHARLAAARPGLRVLFMSGYAGDVVAFRGVLEEGLEFIHKPFSSAELTRKIRDVLSAPASNPA
jgi:two-component system cell cycle sensor histidine kinase/response regulator CckA